MFDNEMLSVGKTLVTPGIGTPIHDLKVLRVLFRDPKFERPALVVIFNFRIIELFALD